jgi:hypothetical protein
VKGVTSSGKTPLELALAAATGVPAGAFHAGVGVTVAAATGVSLGAPAAQVLHELAAATGVEFGAQG